MAHTSRSLSHAAALAGAAAALGLLTACGGGSAAEGSAQASSGSTAVTGGTAANSAGGSGSSSGGSAAAAGSMRCHTSELRASVGSEGPGAGQENFALVLTNASGHTCTVTGYPGAAFTDASGRQLGPDPQRGTGAPMTIALEPGKSAWSGLKFANPDISGAKTAIPAWLLITPPNERDSLKVKWADGSVPVSGNSSSTSLTLLSPGTGS
jgi:hypothetical protein